MQDSFDVTTVIFLALAVFVIWRLRSVLGQKTGQEKPPPMARGRGDAAARVSPAAEKDNVVRLPGAAAPPAPVGAAAAAPRNWSGIAEPDSPAARGFDAIAAVEPGFDAAAFLGGAKVAYETIVIAFAKGDRPVLKTLLSRDVAEGFERAIAERDGRGDTVETTFVSIDRAEVVGVDVRNRVAQVTVRFLSKLITATRGRDGAVIDGSPEAVVDVTDVWTFARTLGTRDPNWQLVATEAGQ